MSRTIVMDDETARYVLNLEGRLTALSGIVCALIYALRQTGAMTQEMERQLFDSASAAVATLPPELEPSADRLILALSNAQPADAP
jgi:hypothetical protein